MPANRTHRLGGAYPRPPLPPDESERITALRQYDILDTEPEQAYDDLTLLASVICDTPIALVSLIDTDRQWFKSRIGINVSQTHRDVAFCAHAVASGETLVVNDATKDERFAQNPLVINDPQIRFYAGAPLRISGGRSLGTLCVIDRVPRELTDRQQAALEALSRQVVAQLELHHNVSELKDYALRDSLTGLYNRRYFESAFPRELARSKRYQDPLALLLIDVDRFKTINDEFGHPEGDRVLMRLSGFLSDSVRAADIACRYGGEEFAVILPSTTLDVAARLGERIRSNIANSVTKGDAPLRVQNVTITIGVAGFPEIASDAKGLVAIADRRLYTGKSQGRDRVVASD